MVALSLPNSMTYNPLDRSKRWMILALTIAPSKITEKLEYWRVLGL